MTDSIRQQDAVGVKGVLLKKFEQVVASLLPHIRPEYVQLPSSSSSSPAPSNIAAADADVDCNDWPFQQLPPAARVYGELPGQLSDFHRAQRKEQQLRSILKCMLALLPKQVKENYTVVDFGGGSGHLAIPLACLLPPHCRVIVVDLSQHSLDLLTLKAKAADVTDKTIAMSYAEETMTSDNKFATTAISNLVTFCGPIEAFQRYCIENDVSFDMGVALHLCGEATDVALRLCGHLQVHAIVTAPCCVGKLNATKKNPYIYQATGANVPTVTYPQSTRFAQIMLLSKEQGCTDEAWNALARAADYSDMLECRTSRNAARRTAKALLETDRRLFLQECFGYETALCRMDPWEATPKNDILLAWKQSNGVTTSCSSLTTSALIPDPDCQADIQWTIDHLLIPTPPSSFDTTVATDKNDATAKDPQQNSVDWMWEEEQEIRMQMEQHFDGKNDNDEDSILIFKGMCRRKRKLVHYVAQQMGLAHWGCYCEGMSEKIVETKKCRSKKAVAVARKGRRRDKRR